MPSYRPELSSMADDYASHALSQRAAFEATHPAALATARQFANEPVLRVVDLGAADGVNSHGLIRSLIDERDGRPLVYALVDLPTNAWAVAAEHLRRTFGDAVDGTGVIVTPEPGDAGPGAADVGTGIHWASPEAHGAALSPGARAQSDPERGDQPGGHPARAGAVPAAGHRARRGQRHRDALDRGGGRPRLDRVGVPGLPGP